MLGKQSEPRGQRLFLHIDRDSLVTMQKTGNKIFTGLSQGIIKGPERSRDAKGGNAPSIASSRWASERGGK
jgi:hypothetical protein